VDVDPDTYNIDASKAEAAITSRTRAIIAVHIYGQPADMRLLDQISKDHKIPIIEDAAQAHGATYNGAKAGSFGIAAAFSFYPTKNLGALGDGGAVTTNNESIARSVRAQRNYGSSAKYRHDELGCNSRLDELQASYLNVKLSILETKNARRRAIATRYTDGLRNTPSIRLPVVVSSARPAWHLYVIAVTARDQMQAQLNRVGIHTMIHYPIPPHQQLAYAGKQASKIRLPCTERAAKQVLSLPMWPELTDEEIDRVINSVLGAVGSSKQFELSANL
jgi:dTDP-4-amino-4,6-dideoxygalactose transaminase